MDEARREEIIKNFLRYSFGAAIGQGWEVPTMNQELLLSSLTATERRICTEEEFQELLKWVFDQK